MNNHLAKEWDASVQAFYQTHGQAFGRTRGHVWQEQRLAAKLIQPQDTVLDIGAGNGRFASVLPAEATYIGIEPSDTLRATAPTGIDLRKGALPSLSLPDQIADITVCFAVFHHLSDDALRAKSAQELIRVTKPGGAIVATSWYLAPNDPRLEPTDATHPHDKMMSWKAEGADAKRYVHLFDEADWRRLWDHPHLKIERIGLFGKDDWTDDPTQARNWCVIAWHHHPRALGSRYVRP